MNPNTNPFTPGSGIIPPILAGREQALNAARLALGRTALANHVNSQLIVGLRGVGKSSLLNRIELFSGSVNYNKYIVGRVELKVGDDLKQVLIPVFRSILLEMKYRRPDVERVNEALRVLRSFMGNQIVSASGQDISLAVEPELGFADSGDFTDDLKVMITAIGTAAREIGQPVTLMLDDLHTMGKTDLAALVRASHKQSQIRSPFLVFMAGLPHLLNQIGEAINHGERNIDVHHIGALSRADAWEAVGGPIERLGKSIAQEAMWAMEDFAFGYPYLLQAIAYHTWNYAKGNTITQDDVLAVRDKTLQYLDNTFYRVLSDRIAPVERQYLVAMASLPAGPQRSADVAKAMQRRLAATGTIRDSLIKKGVIFSPDYGMVSFTSPQFAEFINRQTKDE